MKVYCFINTLITARGYLLPWNSCHLADYMLFGDGGHKTSGDPAVLQQIKVTINYMVFIYKEGFWQKERLSGDVRVLTRIRTIAGEIWGKMNKWKS